MNSTLTAHNAKNRKLLSPAERNLRRKLIIQDSLVLLSLTAITICIAVLTYFFFHSFREHRRVLEKRWFARGEMALAAAHPQDAVQDFRSALSLSSANRDYEMALAEALAAAGQTDEAYAYFSNLHDAEPGDGFLNLQLARLAVRRKDPAQAIAFYHSALNGSWHGQGAELRLQIRLELAKYLLSLGKISAAQGDLLTAEGNSLDRPSALFEIADLLKQAEDPSDAWEAYRRVERHSRANPSQIQQALLGEARAAISMGQYKRAALALDRFEIKAHQHPSASTPKEKREVSQQLGQLKRMLQLIPFYGLQPIQHAKRLLVEANIAHQRLQSCLTQIQTETASGDGGIDGGIHATDLSALESQWEAMAHIQPSALAQDAAAQQSMTDWTSQTEIVTSNFCGAPTGDNALLLQLALVPDKTE